MDTKKVSLAQSNGLLRQTMNTKIQQDIVPVLDGAQDFQAPDVTQLQSLSDLSIKDASDNVLAPAINAYLGKKSKDPMATSSIIAEMGTTLFQNLRIYRDFLYTKQNRKDRLLSAFKGTLWKSLSNKTEGTAYI